MTVGGDRPSKKDKNFDPANWPDRISQSQAAKMLNEAQELKAIESEKARERQALQKSR